MTAPPAPLPPNTDGEPRIDTDLLCSGCQYNLRTVRRDGQCPECGQPVAKTLEDNDVNNTVFTLYRFPMVSRVICMLLGVVWPIFPFVVMEEFAAPSGGGTVFTEYQSGRITDYIGLMVGGPPSRLFYPFLLLAMAGMVAVVFRPLTWGRRRWVHLALLAGVIMGIQYTTLLVIGLMGLGLPWTVGGAIACGAVGGGLVFTTAPAMLVPRSAKLPRMPRKTVIALRWVFAGIAAVLLLGGVVGLTIDSVGTVIGVAALLFPGLLGSPWLFMMVYVMTLMRVWRSYAIDRPDRSLIMILLSGAAAYLIAWAGSVVIAIQEYQKLPTEPHHCFIATAAARGHRRLVRPRYITLPDGRSTPISRQLQTLKAGELALRELLPRTHRLMRRAYDTIGPHAARRLGHPLAADLAYLVLAPIAWATRLVLRPLIPAFDQQVERIYLG